VLIPFSLSLLQNELIDYERRKFSIDRSAAPKSLSIKERSNSQKPSKRDEVFNTTKKPPLCLLLREEAQTNACFKARVFTFLLKTKSMRIVLVGMKRETNN
jgi:hypothetical protein